MTMIFDWPTSLVPDDVQVMPPRQTFGGTPSLSGAVQTVPAIRPPFGLVLPFGSLFGPDVLAYRALLGLFEGRANICRIPLFDLWYRASDAAIGAGLALHGDGISFSDGAAYLTGDLDGVLVSGLQGDRTITVDFGSYGQILQGGQYFGLGEHPYLATGVWWTGTVATIRCTPTLRIDHVATPLKLKPTMLAGLVGDDTGQLMLKGAQHGTPTLDLVERFDGPVS